MTKKYDNGEFSSADIFLTKRSSMGALPSSEATLDKPLEQLEPKVGEKIPSAETEVLPPPLQEENTVDNLGIVNECNIEEQLETHVVCEPVKALEPLEILSEDKLLSLLNFQVGHETSAATLYLVLSGVANNLGFFGTEKFFLAKYDEELNHAKRIFKYLLDKQYPIFMPEMPAILVSVRSIEEFFSLALSHEKSITKRIHELYLLASKIDPATAIFLEWYVREQVEEEAGIKSILDRINLAQGNISALLSIDTELLTK